MAVIRPSSFFAVPFAVPVTIHAFLAIYACALFILVTHIWVTGTIYAKFLVYSFTLFIVFLVFFLLFCCSCSASSMSWTSIFPSLFRSGMLVSGFEGGGGAGWAAAVATFRCFGLKAKVNTKRRIINKPATPSTI